MRLFPFFLLLLTASCANKTKEPPAAVKAKTLVTLPLAPEKLKGIYTGDFKGSPLALTLNYATHSRVSGYDVHKGLTRNLSGTVETTKEGLHLQLSEPGNNPFDGKFDFVIDTATWSAKGTWTPLKKGEATSFVLKKGSASSEANAYEITLLDSRQNSITLKPDGSCVLNLLTDTTNTGQPLLVRGSYTQTKNTLTVFWQKNKVFPSGKSVFRYKEIKPDPESDYTERTLTGEGRVFTQLNF